MTGSSRTAKVGGAFVDFNKVINEEADVIGLNPDQRKELRESMVRITDLIFWRGTTRPPGEQMIWE